MNILAAIQDSNLFRPYVTGSADGSLETWTNWSAFLRTLYGLPTTEEDREIIASSTGRLPELLPSDGFSECLLLAGRRSGKSKVIALVGAAEALFSGREKGLSAGEIPLVAIVSPTRNQSRIIHGYMRAVFNSSPLLENEVVEENREGFVLKNGVEISISTGKPGSVRGFTLIACVIDEVAMFDFSEESKITDIELIRALRPALASTGGRLLAVGTPFAPRGYSYSTWKRCWGNDESTTLVWNAPSLTMNSTLSSQIVERALAEDPVAAAVEYCVEPGLFRQDIDDFVSRQVVESLVVRGRKELPPRTGTQYAAFCDVSGGRHDDAALSIAHKEGRTVVIDALKRYKSPHNPFEIVAQMCQTIKRYNCKVVAGDSYAAEWSKRAFEQNGVRYRRVTKSVWQQGSGSWKGVAKPKSQLYSELLPRLHSGEIELLDDETLIMQLCSLQRRTRSGGRDTIDHPPGPNFHDDLANAIAGVCDAAVERRARIGAFSDNSSISGNRKSPMESAQENLDKENQRRRDEESQPASQDAEWCRAMRHVGRL